MFFTKEEKARVARLEERVRVLENHIDRMDEDRYQAKKRNDEKLSALLTDMDRRIKRKKKLDEMENIK